MNLYSIETGNLMLDGGALFGVVPKSIWSKKYPANENNLCNICMRCLLIEQNNRLILIDCGMGNTMNPNLLKYYFTNGEDTLKGSLNKAGFCANDITDVVFTHMHFDHCGGAVTKNADDSFSLTFKNAQYWISEQHWQSVLNPNKREKASFLKENIEPIKNSNKINFINCETEIVSGVNLKLFNGHTAGQIIPHVSYNGKTLVYCADLFPLSAHLPLSFVCGYDVEPLVTMKETEEFLAKSVKENYTLFFEHDLHTECCTVKESEKGIVIDKTFTLADFV